MKTMLALFCSLLLVGCSGAPFGIGAVGDAGDEVLVESASPSPAAGDAQGDEVLVDAALDAEPPRDGPMSSPGDDDHQAPPDVGAPPPVEAGPPPLCCYWPKLDSGAGGRHSVCASPDACPPGGTCIWTDTQTGSGYVGAVGPCP